MTVEINIFLVPLKPITLRRMEILIHGMFRGLVTGRIPSSGPIDIQGKG